MSASFQKCKFDRSFVARIAPIRLITDEKIISLNYYVLES